MANNDLGDLISYGTHAARPAAGIPGRLYSESDTGNVYRDTGSVWVLWAVSIAGGAGSDTTAIHSNVSGEIAAVTEKTTPVGADLLLIEDSAATNAKKRLQISNLLARTNFLVDQVFS